MQTLRYIEGEVGGGRRCQKTESYRMWTDSKQTNFLRGEKSHMLFNASTHPDRYQTLASPETLPRQENGREKRQERGLGGKKLNKGWR